MRADNTDNGFDRAIISRKAHANRKNVGRGLWRVSGLLHNIDQHKCRHKQSERQ